MADEKSKPSDVSMTSTSGNNTYTSGSNNNINIGNTYGTPDQRQALEDLLKQLQQEAGSNPAAAAVVMSAEDAVKEATAKDANPARVETRTNLLKKAAEDIEGALPSVFRIAISLIAGIVGLRG